MLNEKGSYILERNGMKKVVCGFILALSAMSACHSMQKSKLNSGKTMDKGLKKSELDFQNTQDMDAESWRIEGPSLKFLETPKLKRATISYVNPQYDPKKDTKLIPNTLKVTLWLDGYHADVMYELKKQPKEPYNFKEIKLKYHDRAWTSGKLHRAEEEEKTYHEGDARKLADKIVVEFDKFLAQKEIVEKKNNEHKK